MRTISLNYQQLSTEFVIVFLGVVLALGVDNWRSKVEDRELEADYLARLLPELELGIRQFEFQSGRFERALAASESLVAYLEQEKQLDPASDLAELFAQASAIGGNSSALIHDAVFQELRSTGRLNIIQNPDIRSGIANYYQQLEYTKSTMDQFPKALILRFAELTNYVPEDFLRFGVVFPEKAKIRLVNNILADPDVVKELRTANSFNRQFLRSFQLAIQANEELTSKLQLALKEDGAEANEGST